MPVIERNICLITALDSRGMGITNLESSGQVKLPYTLPGENVKFEKHVYRNKESYIPVLILNKSSNRISPPCKYFTICGGCSLQHLNTLYYQQVKLNNLQKYLETSDISVHKISSSKYVGDKTRRRAVFEAIKKRDLLFLGFKKFHSNKIINIDSCLLLMRDLSDLIIPLKNVLKSILDNEEKCIILVTRVENGIDLTFKIKDNTFNVQEIETLQRFAINNNVIRLTIIDNIKWSLIHFSQKPYVLFDNISVEVDNHCFLQVSKLSDSILATLVNDIFDKLENTKQLQIADLFCGRGTLTIPASKFGNVDGFEIENSSVKALKKTINNSLLKVIIRQRDLFVKPLEWDELNKYDVAIMNPPRSGAAAQAKLFSTSTVTTILYLSCNLVTFARDVKFILYHNRYKLKEIIPIDQFYWSHHIELLAVFELITTDNKNF